MAFNNDLIYRSVHGNESMQVYSCVADAATGTVSTDLGAINHIAFVPRSMTAATESFKINVLPIGTTSAGSVAVTGVTSGDEFYLTVYGR